VIKTTAAGIIALLLFIACGEKEEDKPEPISGAPITGTIAEEAVAEFSGKNAFAHVEALTAFGPRPIGSEAYQKSLQYLEAELAKLGWKTKRQTFTGITPIGPQEFTNLLARYAPDSDPDWNSSTPFLLCSHLDTKLFAEFEFLGANDSGSSTGVLVEMARVLSAKNEGAKNVELVFFDGEEAILKNIKSKDGLYGSRYYAAQLDKRSIKPQIGIVLDIVGDSNIPLLIGGDTHPALKSQTQSAASKLSLQNWVTPYPGIILDDHVPLMNRANLAVLHLIGDFNKTTYWHKKGDTLDKITPGALENTGKLTLQVLHQLTK
jgi:hypothetical protein